MRDDGVAAGPVLWRGRFDLDGQRRFAKLSGDWNPAHLDPVSARREIFGGVVAHGINLLLLGLDALAARAGSRLGRVASLQCVFEHPAPIDEEVVQALVEEDGDCAVIEARCGAVRVLRAELRFSRHEEGPGPPIGEPETDEEHAPRVLDLRDMVGLRGALNLWLRPSLAAREYPALLATFPGSQLALLLATSRLVGMECPGLRSALSSLALDFGPRAAVPRLEYAVERVISSLRRVEIRILGPDASGSVVAFATPEPQGQPGIADVARAVEPGEFSGQRALIVGGSRGLGEVTAKILAAGGALPVITYLQGAADAARVAAEIRGHSGWCEILSWDVAEPGPATRELVRWIEAPTHIYYFASPHIFGPRSGLFDARVFRRFATCYVEGLVATYSAVRSLGATPLAVFYPSSEAVAQKTANLAEYGAAKAAGEFVCELLAARDPLLKVLVKRLPRTATDQTLSLVPYPAQGSLGVMLPIVRELSRIARP